MSNIWLVDNRDFNAPYFSNKNSMTNKLISLLRQHGNLLIVNQRNYDKLCFDSVNLIVLSGSDYRINNPRHFDRNSYFACSVLEKALEYMMKHANKKISVLGICYGMHLLVRFFYGTVHTSEHHIKNVSQYCNPKEIYLNYHDYVTEAPEPFVRDNEDDANLHVLSMSWPSFGWKGVQFHPEGTDYGIGWLHNFVAKSLGMKNAS